MSLASLSATNLLNFVQMYMLLLQHYALFCCSVKYLVSDLVKIIHTDLKKHKTHLALCEKGTFIQI